MYVVLTVDSMQCMSMVVCAKLESYHSSVAFVRPICSCVQQTNQTVETMHHTV